MNNKRKVAVVAYAAIPGSNLSNKDAQIVGAEVDRIVSVNGVATAALVLETARSPSSPLHRFFEWDDAIAAEEHRLSQARALIRSVRIVRKGQPTNGMRAFQIVSTPERGYIPTEIAMRNVDMMAELISRAKAEQKSWAHRHARLRDAAQLSGVFDALVSAGIIEES